MKYVVNYLLDSGGFNMSYDISKMNMDSLQEYFALQYYKVYHRFPKAKHLENNRAILLYKIRNLKERT